MSYTSSIENWIEILEGLKNNYDVDTWLPGHGGIADDDEIQLEITFLNDITNAVRNGIENDVSLEQLIKEQTFEEYSDWRHYDRRHRSLRHTYYLLKNGRPEYFDKVKAFNKE